MVPQGSWRDGVAITPPPGFASLGGCGPTRTSPERPLNTGLLEGCTPWGVLVGTKVLGPWCSHCLRPAVKWAWCRRPSLGDGVPGHLAAGGNVPCWPWWPAALFAARSDCM